MNKENEPNLSNRPPVVVVMGHVDHGKTSILDYIRKTHITDKESGGITQHIGASEIEYQGKKITFIDTPGHEAFSQMRLRGAKVADIAILVVAAEESLKPQTKEAIAHIKKADIPLIVAINKIDKAEANPDKVKRDLQNENVLVEEWGGTTPAVNVSAKTGQGVEDLLETILLVGELGNLNADASKQAEGIIIESSLDPKRGPSATLLLQNGSLSYGKSLATETALGKIKIMENFRGKKLDTILPSQPALVIGFESLPRIGEIFREIDNLEEKRKEIEVKKQEKATRRSVIAAEKGKKILNLILKTDFGGSGEVLEETIGSLPQEHAIIRIICSGTGEINLNDAKMARSGKAIVIGFRVKIHPAAQALAEREKIRIMNFDIIYELIEWLRKHIDKMKEPEIVRKDLGKLKVLLSFWAEKNRQIVGGKIIDGSIKKGTKIEVLRSEEVLGQGRLINLQKNKKDINEASKGEEVGILYEGSGKIQEGDHLVIYTQEKNF